MSSPDPWAGLTAARASDTLDALGYRSQVMDAGIRPLGPGVRAVGAAATVAFAEEDDASAVDEADPYGPMIAFIDGLRPGELVVLAAAGTRRSACWGQLFSAAALGRGAVGVVCDGFVRDAAEIAALGFPTLARGTRPIDYRARLRVAATRHPVTCGGVAVSPGDTVVVDDDGAVVVPAAVADELLVAARRRAGSENSVLDELVAGASLREVWDRHRVL